MNENEEIINIEEIEDKVLLFNIIDTYREWFTENEILEVTERAWKLDKKRKDEADYALAVYKDKIVGVFTIISWYKDPCESDRFDFKGEIATENIRNKYINKQINTAWKQGQLTPFIYINC